jgi:hypothetical protein
MPIAQKPRIRPASKVPDLQRRGEQLVRARRNLVKQGQELFKRLYGVQVWLASHTGRGTRSPGVRWYHRRIGPGVRGLITAHGHEITLTPAFDSKGQLILRTVIGVNYRKRIIGCEFARVHSDEVGFRARGPTRWIYPTGKGIEIEWCDTGKSLLKRHWSAEIVFRLLPSVRQRERLFGADSPRSAVLREAKAALQWAVNHGPAITG